MAPSHTAPKQKSGTRPCDLKGHAVNTVLGTVDTRVSQPRAGIMVRGPRWVALGNQVWGQAGEEALPSGCVIWTLCQGQWLGHRCLLGASTSISF